MTDQSLWTTQQVADYLQVDRKWMLRVLVHEGLPIRGLGPGGGRPYRADPGEVIAWCEARKLVAA